MSQVPDSFGIINNTIKVAKGHYFDLADPNPDAIDLFSIASALGNICRFGGHCPRFYSVAEHCIKAADLAASKGCSQEEVTAVLLHDAAEAYIGDMVKPLKVMMPGYVEIEQKIENAIATRFGISFDKHSEVIKEFDRAMLKVEKCSMWPQDSEVWSGFNTIPLENVRLDFMGPMKARDAYLNSAFKVGLLVSNWFDG